MPTPMEPDCWKTLFAMTTALGAVASQAKNNKIWDKASLAYMGRNLVRLIDDCDLAIACKTQMEEFADAAVELLNMGEADPEQVDGQLTAFGGHMLNLTACMFDAYAVIADSGQRGGRPFTDWPDEDWLMEFFPKRVREVR